MKTKPIAIVLVLALIAVVRSSAAPAAVKEVVIVANDLMKYSVTHIDANPGQTIHVLLKNQGTQPKEVMGHNWVLLKSGIDPMKYAAAAISAAGEGYQPKSLADEVLAAIPVIGPRHEGEVTFDAPKTPGTYAFLCSFPAHCQTGMRGELVVK